MKRRRVIFRGNLLFIGVIALILTIPGITAFAKATGSLYVTVTPSEAEVYIDGKLIGKASPSLFVQEIDSGQHILQIAKTDYEIYKEQIIIIANEVTKLQIHLTRQRGTITVLSEPIEASVYLDGSYKGKTPLTIKDVDVGTHQIVIAMKGYALWVKEILVSSKKVSSVEAKLIVRTLEISSEPSGTNVYINEELRGKTPLKIEFMEAGTYTIKWDKEDYLPVWKDIAITPDQQQVSLDTKLIYMWGAIFIDSQPSEADVYIDGKYVGKTPLEQILKIGDHFLEVTKFGYSPHWRSHLILKPEEFIPFQIKLRKQSETSWLMSRGNPSHTGYTTQEITPPLTLAWQLNVRSCSPPAVNNGVMYLVIRGGEHHYICALDAASGSIIWKYKVDNPEKNFPPAVANGIVYITAYKPTGVYMKYTSYIYALDVNNGSLIWKKKLGEKSGVLTAIANNALYIDTPGMLYALDSATGSVIWQYKHPYWIEFSSPITAYKDVILGMTEKISRGTWIKELYALKAKDGSLLWKRDLETGQLALPLVADDNIIYAIYYWGHVWAYSIKDGSLIWEYKFPERARICSQAVANGKIYFGSRPYVYALNAKTGTLIWKTNIEDNIPPAWRELIFSGASSDKIITSLTLARNVIYGTYYTAIRGAVFFALDTESGNCIWTYETSIGGNPPTISPVIANDFIYTGFSGELYAFQGLTDIFELSPLDYITSQWDEYGPGLQNNWSPDQSEELWGRKVGYISYAFIIPKIQPAVKEFEITALLSSELKNITASRSATQYSSDVTLLINDTEIGTKNIIPDNGQGENYSWIIPASQIKKGKNILTFRVKENAQHKNGLVIYTRQPIQLRTLVEGRKSTVKKVKKVKPKPSEINKQETLSGLTGKYFNLLGFHGKPLKFPEKPDLSRVDKTIDFNWEGGRPDPAISSDYFGIRWTGFIYIPTSDIYKFKVWRDDGCRLWFDNKLIFDAWYEGDWDHWIDFEHHFEKTGWHSFKLEFYEIAGGARITLKWQPPEKDTFEIIPSSHLKPSAEDIDSTIITMNGREKKGIPTGIILEPGQSAKISYISGKIISNTKTGFSVPIWGVPIEKTDSGWIPLMLYAKKGIWTNAVVVLLGPVGTDFVYPFQKDSYEVVVENTTSKSEEIRLFFHDAKGYFQDNEGDVKFLVEKIPTERTAQ